MTDAHDLAGQIRRDLYGIVDNYDEALEPARRANGSQVKATREPPLPIGAHVLDVRAEAHRDLMYWTRFLLDEVKDVNGNPIQHGPASVEPAALVPFIATWVDWLIANLPDDADNLAGEASKHAKALRQLAAPQRREWMPIGECPVTVADKDGNSVECGAKVRAYPERAFIRCPGCGTEDTLAWWMSQIVPEGSDLAHADAVIACVVSRTFQPLTHEQLRQWAARGFVMRHGKDTKGRTLYSSKAVLAYAQHQIKEEAA
jgi:hypothetical protein